MKRTIYQITVGVILIGALVSVASATTVRSKIKPHKKYGKVNQRHPDITAIYGNCACAPTSTINSFVYLMAEYGLQGLIDDLTGDGKVDDDDYIKAVIKMGGKDYMNLVTDPNDPDFCKGISDDKMITGKKNWIKEYNKLDTLDIVMKGQDDDGVGGLKKIKPTAQFIYQELKACEDVEIGFTWTTGDGGGHWVTAYGIEFTDLGEEGKENDIFDVNETGTLKFIDPWGTGTGVGDKAYLDSGTLETGGDGWLWLTYGGHKRKIDIIVSESPVPEPSSTLCVFLGLCGLGRYIRRRRLA